MSQALKALLMQMAERLPTRAVNATFEHIPGRASGHLAGLLDAPFAERMAYTEAVPWSNPQTGRDILYELLGLNAPPTRRAMGAYQPPPIEGVPQPFEANPAMVARPRVPFAQGAPVPEATAAMDAAETVRGLMDVQNASAYHLPTRLREVTDNAPFSGIRLPFSGPMDEPGVRSLAQLTRNIGLDGVSDTGAGVTMFPKDQSARQLQELLSGGELERSVSDALAEGGSQRMLRASPYVAELSPSNYISLFEQNFPEGSGQLTQEALGKIDPRLLELLSGQEARNVYGAKASMDELFSGPSMGMPRGDVQNMRKVASKYGLNALLEQARQGKYLPAVAAMGGYGALRRAGRQDTPQA